MQNYYDILNLKKEASPDEIKKSYRKLAREYHPDKNQGDTKKEEMFKLINEAYSTLSDEEKRKAYDLRIFNKDNKSNNFNSNKTSNTQKTNSGTFDMNDFEKRFESFFGFNSSGNKVDKSAGKGKLNTDEMFNSFFKVKK